MKKIKSDRELLKELQAELREMREETKQRKINEKGDLERFFYQIFLVLNIYFAFRILLLLWHYLRFKGIL